ncbi:MAG: acylneuraminate cytidylyltransferase family protein [Phycisphaerae bacterium]
MRIVGIIPARRGSKRLAHKNLAPLGGRPLLAHTCAAALQSGALARVLVNTDSPDIAAVALQCGVECPALRPARLAQDDTPTRLSNMFLLEMLATGGERFDAIMVLQPTSPLRTAADIASAAALFERARPCAVVSVSPVAPASWLGRVDESGTLARHEGDATVYRLNGAIYLHEWSDYVNDRTAARTVAYVMPAERGVDIDTAADLAAAEGLLRHVQAHTTDDAGAGHPGARDRASRFSAARPAASVPLGPPARQAPAAAPA